MAVTFDAQTTPTIAVTGTSFSDTNLTIGSSANALIVLISTAGDSSTPTVTWNGVALTALVETVSTGVNGYAGIFGLLNPATGNHTLAGSWVNSNDAFISGVSFSGVDTTNLSTAFPHTGSNTGTSTTASVTTTSSVGDIVAAVQAVPFQSSTPPVPDNINIFNRVSAGGFGGSANRAAGAASVTLSATLFSSRAWAASGVDIGAAPITVQLRAPHLSTQQPPILAVPQSQPYNLNLYAIVAVPFFTQDFATSHTVPDWLPPIQYPNLSINTVGNPFHTQDFTTSHVVPNWLPPTQYPNIVLVQPITVASPFYLQDFSKPFTPVLAKPDQQSLNINIFTNPVPFQNNWFNSTSIRPIASDQNNLPDLVLQNFSTPFVSTDWSKAFDLPSIVSINLPNIVLLNPAVVSNPFYPQDFSRPFVPVLAKYDQQSVNTNLFTNPIPFGPYDWSKPFSVPLSSFEAVNMVLISTAAPFYTQDFSRPNIIHYLVPDQNNLPNIVINAPVIVVSPFYTQDFSKPFVPSLAKYDQQALNINLYTNPTPFALYDWPRVNNVKLIVSDQTNLPNVVLPNSPFPFYTQDWSKTQFLRTIVSDQSNLPDLVLLNFSTPFVQTDWSKTGQLRPIVSDQSNLPNITLINPPFPFYTQDWSKTQFIPSVPQPPSGMALNPNLYGNPIPLNQIDWSKPYRIVPIASDQNNLPNLILAQPSTPSTPLGIFSWRDWGKTKSPVILIPDQDNLPNIVLIVTPPTPEVHGQGGKWRWLEDYEKIAHQSDAIKQAAAILSKMGGHARAQALTAKQRSAIASKAASIRWK